MSAINSIMFIFKIVVPAYYSLKFLKKRDPKLISNILKFWCINSVWTVFEYLIPLVVDQWFFFLANITLYLLLTFPNYDKSQTVFDYTISKLYQSNQQVIQQYADKIEIKFDATTGSITNKVKDVLTLQIFPKLQLIFEKTVKKAIFSFGSKPIEAAAPEQTDKSASSQEEKAK